ncbi:MAG: hypothetical protein ACXAC8_01045 [Candidatus Hodarchaeales archaeon]
MLKLAKCPECGGKAKWESPFYVCSVCGLALRRREYEREHDRVRNQVLKAQADTSQEDKNQDQNQDFIHKRKRNREYLDWFLGSKK